MRLKDAEIRNIADTMTPYFQAIVQATGTLNINQMRTAIQEARRDGVDVPNVSSARTMRIINQAYMEGS